MKKAILIFLQLFLMNSVKSQVFDVQNIQYKGDPNKYINIVILGDGYTVNEQQTFIDKVTTLTNDLFSQEPWSNYKNYFNVYAIKVISLESGVKHPVDAIDCNTASVPFSNPNNYLGSSFDVNNVHRAVMAINGNIITGVLATNFPNYDNVVVLVNTPYYGGTGGSRSTITDHPNSKEILIHELGHSFGDLGDEYNTSYFDERANRTQQNNPALIKWKNWLSTPQIGINAYGNSGLSSTWFKPTNNTCKMQVLGVPYCSVCKEKLIESIHTKANPIVNYSPSNATTINSPSQFLDFSLTELMKPIPNTLTIKWQLDATIFNNNAENFQVNQNNLSNGSHTLTATVVDETAFVKTDNHNTIHFNTVTWTIQKNSLGVSTIAESNQIGISVFPNPSTDKVTIQVDLEKSSSLSIELVSIDGKIIKTIPNKDVLEGKTINSFYISNLASGNYIFAIKVNG